jgi:hypothetical protein
MAAGFDDTVIRKTGYINKIEQTIQDYTIFANKGLFPNAGPAVTPGSEKISWLIDYDTTNNGGLMSAYSDAAPSPDDMTRIEAYQNKDYFQHTSLIYDILVNQVEVNADGNKVPGTSYQASAIENSARLMAADIASAYVADLKALIDSAGSFSDASLLRSTYNLASKEEATVGTLALTDLDSLIAALLTKEYGRARREDLFWLMSSTNQRRVANLSTKVQYGEFNASSDSTGNIDGGRANRVMSYEGIPIYIEDSMGDADILLLRKGTVTVFDHWQPALKDLNVEAFQQKSLMGMGSNIVVTNPRWNAKASGITG